MRQEVFIARRRDAWRRLEELTAKAERRGIRALPAEELDQLGRHYRAATSDLATAQTRAYDEDILNYLNRLVARGHAVVYAGTASTGTRHVV
ncbi:MAG: stage II sporulation protein M, partial [Candidatus Eremiobacteraeota bacterium]|nr:stage II sporulation protein M [Candidatus Eremiobacteraeota bacterium]